MVVRILGFNTVSQIDQDATLLSLGLDSIMAVELQHIVERVTGNKLSAKEIREMTFKQFSEATYKD